MELNKRQHEIINTIIKNGDATVALIRSLFDEAISPSSINRDLASLVKERVLVKKGTGRSTYYVISSHYAFFKEDIGDSYFDKDVDEREGRSNFNSDIFEKLEGLELFTPEEEKHLNDIHQIHLEKISNISPTLLKKETERLSIELSWKSSQIEGNTYSLLETELLLSERLVSRDHTQAEAIMLINHKVAIDYIYEDRLSFSPLRVSTIEDVHHILTKDLGIERNLRRHAVGITGTSYGPPDNEFQIREYLDRACVLINSRESIFEKSMLTVLFVSYIQPFEDGNKRTGRISGNGILIENGYCPLSYRSISPLAYKKAMILFYEQNNISAYKKLFMEQYEFAVKNYF